MIAIIHMKPLSKSSQDELVKGILEEGKAHDMPGLLTKYKEILKERGVNEESYTKHRLKERLKKHFSDEIEFFQVSRCKPDIVYSSALSIQDLINKAAEANAQGTTTSNDMILRQQISDIASHIREEIRKSDGINLRPLDVKDICMETVHKIVPPSLYLLLRQIICPSELNMRDDIPPCKRMEDERKVLAIAQDVIHSASNSRVKLPKQISLAMTVRHLTGSKVLITLLNRMGHCSSYDEVQAVDTSLAIEVAAMAEQIGTVLPSNISSGPFIHLAADNNDINEETLDGKTTTHATTMVVYQRRPFGPPLPPTPRAAHTTRRRSLDAISTLYEIEECSMQGRRPSVKEFKGLIKKEWFAGKSEKLSGALEGDTSWAILRIDPSRLLTSPVEGVARQLVPSWSGFNAILYPDIACPTNIGYCPLIDASSTEFSTVYTVMKLAQRISESVGQSEVVITFDLAIYVKAKQIQLIYPADFANVIICLGGFHIALNYLAIVGKKDLSSGLEDLLIESGVYAAGTTSVLMNGRSYNRGVRAHKLCFEALFRLLWKAFLTWYVKREEESILVDDTVKKKLTLCREKIGTDAHAEAMGGFESIQEDLKETIKQLEQFKRERRETSKFFAFWEEYAAMVELLLQFIKAERTGNWKLHLDTVAAMTPYFFAMDRHNYARWLPENLADMNQMEIKHPTVYRQFMSGNHVVSRASNPFSQVSTDMALEQSINGDSKSKGGIVGISQRPAALERWFLTSHERAAITKSLKSMYGVVRDDRLGAAHKESSANRITRDEADVQKLLTCFTSSLMSDPFSSDAGEEVLNFATGVVLPTDISDNLLSSTEKGREQMDTFVEKRLNKCEVNFWDPLPNLKIETFSSTTKKTHVKASNDEFVTVRADRDLFGRLLIASNARQIDLKEVLSYELSTVPFALAHLH